MNFPIIFISGKKKRKSSLWRRKMVDSANLVCPYCGHTQDMDTMYHHISYWGDDETICYCEDCGKKFLVVEKVNRYFSTTELQTVEQQPAETK
jgi:DNA-directed RNA polymerase subunit RPC12/RpoP